MFKLKLSNTFTSLVLFQVPGDGQVIQGEFTGTFNRLSQTQLQAIANPETRPDDDKLLDQVFVGWGDDLCDEFGTALAVSDTNRAMLFDIAGMKRAILTAYVAAQAEAGPRSKN